MQAGIELPEKLPGRGLERDHLLRGRVGKENPPDDDRIRFQTTFFGGIKLPCLLKPLYIAAIYLRKRRVVITFGLSAVYGPISTVGQRIAFASLSMQSRSGSQEEYSRDSVVERICDSHLSFTGCPWPNNHSAALEINMFCTGLVKTLSPCPIFMYSILY